MSEARQTLGATHGPATTSDVVEFLRLNPPFDGLERADVERLAAVTEIEFHRAGSTIFSQAERNDYLRVIRSGEVEIVHDGRVLDVIGPGEMFGHASMLSGLPTGFMARAVDDTLTYRLPSAAAADLLSHPRAMAFVARKLLEDPHGLRRAPDPAREQLQQPVGTLVRSGLVVCPPTTSLREAAKEMSAANATALVVDLGDSLGIVTDHDLRSRVVAAGLSTDVPVAGVMSAPAETVPFDRPAGEVLLDMLDRGWRHFPVVSTTGRVVGVVEASDLVAVQTRSSFALRQAIGGASTMSDLVEVSARIFPSVVAMHEAHMSALDISALFSIVVDALTRKVLELVLARSNEPPVPFAWLALGSHARREAVPSSDVDSGIVWLGEGDASMQAWFLRLASEVLGGLQACGFQPDANRATAADPLFVRSLSSWREAERAWLEVPTADNATVMVSVLVDSRPIWGLTSETAVSEPILDAPRHPGALRHLARLAISHRPPTGFLRGLVVEDSGEHRGRLDLKHGGLVPIADLARWAALSAGVAGASTPARLRAAAEAGTLPRPDAESLCDAYEMLSELRLDHQVRQVVEGVAPDNFVDPSRLSALARGHLKEAFRAIASVQRRVANQLDYS